MRDRLLSLLGVESGEESMVMMLLTQSVFLGIFFGAFDISAHSLFLSIFDEKMMAKGYVVSGIAGIILTSVYTWVQTRMQFKNFAIANLITVTLLTILLWAALVINPAKWIIFIVFIMLGPLNILAMLGFWGTTGRLFTLRQGKRLFGLVDVGMIIGVIISCYTIPVLLSFSFASHNILLVSASSIFVASIIQILIGSRFRLVSGSTENESTEKKEKKSVLKTFRDDSYTRTMAIFIALSVITAFFVQYSFMAVTREQYPSEEDMARFLGIFTGSMMIFTLLVKLTVFSYIIRNYGLRTCLAISPILIAAFTAIAIAIGMLMGYTPDSAGSGFLIFFMLLALSRLFSKSLKDSIESPSFKVIYQTIDEKVRYEIQSAMDGTVNEIAALSSGLLLAGLGVLSFIKLIHFSWVLFIIILLWVFVAFKLYAGYRKSIRRALETVSENVAGAETDTQVIKNRYAADVAFKADYFNLISGNYSYLENNKNNLYFMRLIEYSGQTLDVNMLPVLRKLVSGNFISEDIKKKSAEIAKLVEKQSSSSGNEDDRIIGAKALLSGTRLPQTTEILRLLRDNSIESKRLGIFMIGKFKLIDLLPEVCECLNTKGLETDSSAVLRTFGNESVKELIRFYLVSSGNPATSKTILRLLGRTTSEESLGFLLSRIWSNSRQLKEISVKCLIDREFRPSEEDIDRLNQYISDIVGYMTWNLSARTCLERSNDEFLLEVLNREINRWNRFLFSVLALTYDPGSINKIRENLEKETVESVNYALEMIDIVIEGSIKPKLIALLDVIPTEEKLKNLYHFFPGEVPQYSKLLEDIINRDYNMLSLWTKACTLRTISEIEGDNMAESVVALLFSPEAIIQEESAKLIGRTSRELYRSASIRIPETTKKRLDKIVSGDTDDNELLFEKVRFLSDHFSNVPEEELLSLAGELNYLKSSENGINASDDNCIVWPLSNGKTGQYSLPLSAVDEFLYEFPDRSLEILKYIEINEV